MPIRRACAKSLFSVRRPKLALSDAATATVPYFVRELFISVLQRGGRKFDHTKCRGFVPRDLIASNRRAVSTVDDVSLQKLVLTDERVIVDVSVSEVGDHRLVVSARDGVEIKRLAVQANNAFSKVQLLRPKD